MYVVSMRRLVYVTLVCLRHVLCSIRCLTRDIWGEEEDMDEDRLLASIVMPDIHHPAPNAEEKDEEEDKMLLSCR